MKNNKLEQNTIDNCAITIEQWSKLPCVREAFEDLSNRIADIFIEIYGLKNKNEVINFIENNKEEIQPLLNLISYAIYN